MRIVTFEPISSEILSTMSTRSTSDEDAGREIGREDLGENLKSNGNSGKALYISFGTSPRQHFQVQLADCIPCEVAKQASSRNNDSTDPVLRKKKRLKLEDCFGDWGSPPIEADFVSALDADPEEALIPRSFRFGNYPDLIEFLLGNKDDFFHHSANCRTNKAHEFNNDLTVRLIRFADSKGYQFQSLHDDGIFCDDLPTGAEQLPSFKQIRDKVRSFYQRLKSKDSSSSIPIGSDPVPADGTRKVDKEDHAFTGTDCPSTETQDDNVIGDTDDGTIDPEVPNVVADNGADTQTLDTKDLAENSNVTQELGAATPAVATRIIPRSWKWNQYRYFREFLTQNRDDFVLHNTRHAGTPKQTKYNDKITEELLQLAYQNGYQFQCMDDCDEGDTGKISARTGFVFVRHRIRMYYRKHVEDENRRIAASSSNPSHGTMQVTHGSSCDKQKIHEGMLSPSTMGVMTNDLSAEGNAALRALFQTFIRRGTVDTMQLAKAVEATGFTDAFILESARRARQRLFSNSTT